MENLKIFTSHLSNSIQTILKILIFSRFFIKSPKRKNDDCVILANGPSLIDSIDISKLFFNGKDLICVNFFPNTLLFQKLKPQFFICCDPAFWNPELTPETTDQINSVFDAIAKVSWEITVLLPTKAKKRKEWQVKLSSNEKINILFYNATPVKGFDRFSFFLFKKRLGSPRPFNVLIPAILQCINMSYQKVYLLGVDHSWLNDLSVSEKNEVFVGNKHFYPNEKKNSTIQLGRDQKEKWKLYQILETFSIVFHGHHILSKYAKSRNVQVYNLSPDSYIDSFPRLKHPEETMNRVSDTNKTT